MEARCLIHDIGRKENLPMNGDYGYRDENTVCGDSTHRGLSVTFVLIG
jgi:hypothetical protein